ncbi:hypothetical protein ACEQ8H_000927 [Pleosporales sp. CAS-2024a]
MVPLRRLEQRDSQVPLRRLEQRASHRDPHAWHDERDKHIMTATFPIHPLPPMQAPFEESMLDATGETGHVPFPSPRKTVKQRQQMLCREDQAEELQWNFTYNCHWRHYPRGKYHPLVKTVAQIVFGVHLLHQHLEKSVADVADILLKHVNELDSFLQRANEDLDSSLKDMLFRHKCLRVPMEHVSEFDRLLDDRSYRAQLLDGNITIERTITRMSQLLNDYLTDISIFRDANHALDLYLVDIGLDWTYHNADVGKIYSAMCGNTGGWAQFLQSLVAKAERLGVVLVQVGSYCNEIEKRCGAASRRSLVATRSSSRNSSTSREHAFRTKAAHNKDLPPVPSERPSFLSTNGSGSVTPSDIEAGQRHQPQPAKPVHGHQTHLIASPESAGTPKRSEESNSSSGSPDTDAHVRNGRLKPQAAAYNHETRHDGHARGRAAPQPCSTMDKGDLSPPLSGKDSAYHSVSGLSAVSPGASTRSHHAQFALFPSSTRSTPKGSISGRYSGRYGAMSPGPGMEPRPAPSPSAPASRPDTVASRSPDASAANRRLSKRNSFTSLKRLFTKKKSDGINSIPE